MPSIDELKHYQPPADLLKDRVILVTGAGDGIGRGVAKACAAAGASVILLGKTIKKLEAVYDEIEAAGGPQPAIYPLNLEGATVKDYDDLAENIGQEFGRLDGLVNNAAWVGTLTPFKLYDPELWSRVIMTNLHGPFLLTRACLPLLEQAPDAAIVFSSQDCDKAYWGAFGVAKGGQQSMMKILAAEYSGERRMRVNSIDTGPARTQLRIMNYPGEPPAVLPAPETFAAAYVYLLGPEAGETRGEDFRLYE